MTWSHYRVGVTIFLLGLCLLFALMARHEPLSRPLTVTFLDVGQGDAILIEAPDRTQTLVDGGPDRSVLRALGRRMPWYDRSLDFVIATHPDLDHVGGLTDVLSRYQVATILTTDNQGESPAAQAFREYVEREAAIEVGAQRGQVFQIGVGSAGPVTLTILFPDRPVAEMESNLASIVAQVRYGSATFLLTGDSPLAIEEYLTEVSGDELLSTVLKAGHHGSRTSTGATFVAAVQPAIAIISAGRDNRYGHPHQEVTERLAEAGVETHNTAVSGSVVCTSDGLSVRCD
jgi:competence protein ComEC